MEALVIASRASLKLDVTERSTARGGGHIRNRALNSKLPATFLPPGLGFTSYMIVQYKFAVMAFITKATNTIWIVHL
jgi:hypothetical protein